MPDARPCPQCGGEIPPGSPAGLCPKCMMQAGLESHAPGDPARQPTVQPASPSGSRFVPPPPEQLAPRFPARNPGPLGSRRNGAVYKARQLGLDRLVAVKILPPEVNEEAAFAERFTREARALARLSHPNIVAVYDFGQTDGVYFLLMEYVDGVNLRQSIQSGGITPAAALAIVPQICDALQFAHDEGIVHRDIKPENILIDKRGRVKIADFGLARILGRDHAVDTLTATHQVMGTLKYMAPEQMEGAHAVDHRADIYSLGVVFYEMLTGELPLGRFAPPSKKVQVDVRLDEVVLRALEKEPEYRYQSATAVKADVESISRDSAPAATALAPAAAARDVDLDEARAQVRGPAVALLVLGIMNCIVFASSCSGGCGSSHFLPGCRPARTARLVECLTTSENQVKDPKTEDEAVAADEAIPQPPRRERAKEVIWLMLILVPALMGSFAVGVVMIIGVSKMMRASSRIAGPWRPAFWLCSRAARSAF